MNKASNIHETPLDTVVSGIFPFYIYFAISNTDQRETHKLIFNWGVIYKRSYRWSFFSSCPRISQKNPFPILELNP
jgi:hypothetical protein